MGDGDDNDHDDGDDDKNNVRDEQTCPVGASGPGDLDPSFLPSGTSVTLAR